MTQIRKASSADKDRVLQILTEAFWHDPHINWFSGNGPNKGRRIRTMMSHAFEGAVAGGDVYMSQDKEAVAIWRNAKVQRFSLTALWENLKFIYHFGLKKVNAITKLEKLLKMRYPKNEAYHYLYVIGTSGKGRGKGLASQLMNHVLKEADRKGITTYLETANVHNLPIYQKKGFLKYDEITLDGEKPLTLYLMRRKPLAANMKHTDKAHVAAQKSTLV